MRTYMYTFMSHTQIHTSKINDILIYYIHIILVYQSMITFLCTFYNPFSDGMVSIQVHFFLTPFLGPQVLVVGFAPPGPCHRFTGK